MSWRTVGAWHRHVTGRTPSVPDRPKRGRTRPELSATAPAGWAAVDCWRSIRSIHHVERDQRFVELGTDIGGDEALPAIVEERWQIGDIRTATLPVGDVVVAGYLLGELPGGLSSVVKGLWEASSDTVVIVEPGTPRGYEHVIAARDTLIRLGAQIVAPCPTMDPCPLTDAESWCHFAQRLPRSEAHRQVKDVRLPYEDEKYSYVVASRQPGTPIAARVIGMPKRPGGVVLIPTCEGPVVSERAISRRHKAAYPVRGNSRGRRRSRTTSTPEPFGRSRRAGRPRGGVRRRGQVRTMRAAPTRRPARRRTRLV